MSERFFYRLTAHPALVLLAALATAALCVVGYINTEINYDLFSYLPEDAQSAVADKLMSGNFGDSQTALLVAEEMEQHDVAALESRIEALDGVSEAVWLDDIFSISMPYDILPGFIGEIFFSQDGKSTLMLIQIENGDTRGTISSIRSILPECCYLSGTCVISADTKEITDGQVPVYIAVAVAVAFIIMLFILENPLLPAVLLFNLGLGIIYNMGTNIVFGEISYITQSIATVLQLGVTMDYSVFLVDRYTEEKKKIKSRRRAMACAASATLTSLSGSSLTTVSGFIALCFMRLTLGRDIGLVMAKGTLLGVLTVIFVLPGMLLLADKLPMKLMHRSFMPDFSRLNRFILRHRQLFAAALLLLIVPTYLLSSRTEKYYNLVGTLPDDMSSVVALNKLKDDFDMATTHFVIADDSTEPADFSSLTAGIESIDGITNVIAYNKYIGPAIPESVIPEEIRSICKKNGKQIIMVNSALTAGTAEMTKQLEAIKAVVKKYDSSAVIAGEGSLYQDIMDITGRDFVVTSLISIAAVFVIIAVLFHSLTLPLLLVLSIELAIFINSAIPFVMGSQVPFISPAVIGCIQLGATVDYAILLTSRFRTELKNGKNRPRAIKTAADASAKSIVNSALVFFGTTFSVYLISDIEIIKSICAMLARGSLISAGVIIFLLMPALTKINVATGSRKPATAKYPVGGNHDKIQT